MNWRAHFLGVGIAFLIMAGSSTVSATTVYPTAVLPFSERGAGMVGQGQIVADVIVAGLTDHPAVALVKGRDVASVLAELELNLSGLIGHGQAAQIGRMTGAKILVTGSVFKAGVNTYVVAKVMGTETGKVVGHSVHGPDAPDVLAQRMSIRLGELIQERASSVVNPSEFVDDHISGSSNPGRAKALPTTWMNIKSNVQPHGTSPNLGETLTETQQSANSLARLRDARLRSIRRALGRKTLPTVWIDITSRHVNHVGVSETAEAEMTHICRQLGATVVPKQTGSRESADFRIVGEGFSELSARRGALFSVKASLKINVLDRAGGTVVADHETVSAVELNEVDAARAAFVDATSIIAERLLPTIAK